jgi:hypothetical protein
VLGRLVWLLGYFLVSGKLVRLVEHVRGHGNVYDAFGLALGVGDRSVTG